MKNKFILSLLLFSSFFCYSQTEIKPDIKKLQGLWVFTEGHFKDYMFFRDNKKIEISYFLNTKKASIDENTFGYFGFWDSSQHRDEEPKQISQLENNGHIIQFYDDLGSDYDKNGNLLHKTRQCFLTINEDSDDPNPEVLRFYYKSTPDIYTKIKQLPLDVILSLKSNTKEWQKYKNFMDITEQTVITEKCKIYSAPNKSKLTNMYLIKGNVVEVVSKSGAFTKIKFYGKKIIEGWVETKELKANHAIYLLVPIKIFRYN